MISLGAGLAAEGKIPFCSSFTALRPAASTTRSPSASAYANNNVKIVGTAPGITQGSNGGTHMCFQDLAIMRAMPNMHVYSAADAYELRAIMRYMAKTKQPTYLQVIRFTMPEIFDDDYVFDPNAAKVMREGEDVTLVTTGYMLPFVLTAADELAKDGIKADVLHYPSVKPFDAATLVASAKKTGGVVTVENQSILGGLGGAVCEILSEQHPVRVKRLGIPDQVRRGRHGRLPVREARLRRAPHRRRREGDCEGVPLRDVLWEVLAIGATQASCPRGPVAVHGTTDALFVRERLPAGRTPMPVVIPDACVVWGAISGRSSSNERNSYTIVY